MKPVRGLGKALFVLQIIAVAGSILVLVVNIALVDKAETFLDDAGSLSKFRDDLGAYYASAGVFGAVSLAMLILLIIWSFRIAKNLQLRHGNIAWKPGWTIVVWLLGGCTLNIINFLMLREHWIKSDPDPSYGQSTAARPVHPLIVAWFVLSLGQVAAGIASGVRSVNGFSFGNDTKDIAETLTDQLGFTVAAGVLGIAASVVLIFVVRRLTERHAQLTGEV